MQLTGPPKINGWQAPMPSYRNPMEGAWRYDQELTSWIKLRSGRQKLVGEEYWRGQWTVTWDAISYEVAQRILFEVTSANVPGAGFAGEEIENGEFLWTPRTRKPGDPRAIDVNGDGIVDVLLEEVEIPCRLIGSQPSTTEIYRRLADGQKVAQLRLEIQSIRTYQERAGFGVPARISFRVEADSGDELGLEFLDSSGADSTSISQILITEQDGTVVDKLSYPSGVPYTFPDAKTYFVTVISVGFNDVNSATISPLVETDSNGNVTAFPVMDLDFDLSELEDTKKLIFGTTTGGTAITFKNELTDTVPDSVSTLKAGAGQDRGFKVRASHIETLDGVIDLRGQNLYGDITRVGPAEEINITGLEPTTESRSGNINESCVDGTTRKILAGKQQDYLVDLSGSSGIGGGAAGGLVQINAFTSGKGAIQDTLTSEPDLKTATFRASESLSGDLRGQGVIRQNLQTLNLTNTPINYLPDDLSDASSLVSLNGFHRPAGQTTFSEDWENMDDYIQEIHTERPSGNGTLSSFVSTDLTSRIGSALIADLSDVTTFAKWLGLGSYHPPSGGAGGIVDDGIMITCREAWQRGDVVTRVSDTEMEIDMPLIGQLGGGSAPDTERIDNNKWQVLTRQSGSDVWIDRVQAGRQIRLYDDANGADKGLYEIASSSAVDNGDGTATITMTIDSSPSSTNASGTLASDITDADITYSWTNWTT